MKSSTSERLIAVVSAFVAVAIIAVFGVAERTSDVPVTDLPSLEADVRMQFDLALRHDMPRYKRRVAALEAVIDAFILSPQDANDQQLLSEWFQQAIRRTMPGALKPLPPTPEFGVTEPVDPPSPQPASRPAAAGELSGGEAVVSPEPVAEASRTRPQPSEAPQIARQSVPAPTGERASEPTAAFPAADDIVSAPRAPSVPANAGPLPTLADPPAEQDSPMPAPVPSAEVSYVVESAPAPVPVTVNLAELQARIAGYHAGLRNLEARITNAPTRFDLAAAAAAVAELELLAGQFEFVALYYGSLTAEESAGIATPRSPVAAARRLAVALESAAGAEDDFDPFDAAAAEACRKLRDRITAIAGR